MEYLKHFYEEEAKEKEIWDGDRENVLVEHIIDAIPKGINNVLDVGCGSGYLLSNIRSSFGIYGMDLSHNRIMAASSRLPHCKFIESKAEEIAIKPDSFDLIVLSEVLEHIPEYKKALRELVDVAKRYIIITVPNEKEIIKIKCPKCHFEHFLDGHINIFSKKTLASLLSAYPDVKIIKIKTFYTIFTYNRFTWKLPKVIRMNLDRFCIALSRWISFFKPNHILVLIEKKNNK